MESSFFALILRMKHIHRWGLMRNTVRDDLSQQGADAQHRPGRLIPAQL